MNQSPMLGPSEPKRWTMALRWSALTVVFLAASCAASTTTITQADAPVAASDLAQSPAPTIAPRPTLESTATPVPTVAAPSPSATPLPDPTPPPTTAADDQAPAQAQAEADDAAAAVEDALAEAQRTLARAEAELAIAVALVDHPNARGEMVGDVVVLTGTVSTETDKAVIDLSLRNLGFEVENNLNAQDEGAVAFQMLDRIAAQPELSTFRELLELSGLDEIYATTPTTLLAPTNDAFAAMGSELDTISTDADLIERFVARFFLAGEISVAELTQQSHNTRGPGVTVAISTGTGGEPIINDTATVLVGDIRYATGVIHIIDAVY